MQLGARHQRIVTINREWIQDRLSNGRERIPMATGQFAHLHCHSHYSLLDGASRLPELVATVKSRGMNAVALTDHGNLYGAIEFYQECKAGGINPVIGYEAYVAPGSRNVREARRRGDAGFHLTLLAQNRQGFKNLIKLASIAFLEGYHYVPRIDKDALKDHSEGLLVLSGCASSEFSELILKEQESKARELAEWFARTFPGRFFVEIQNNGLEIQRQCADGAIRIANAMGLPLVATSDAHYLSQGDSAAHEVLLCINTGRTLKDENRLRYGSDQFYIRSPEEMYTLFGNQSEAVARSQEIADSVNIELDFTKRHFPVFVPPMGKKPEAYLRELCHAGLKVRYGDNPSTVVTDRMDHELAIIERMGFASYFLVVWDFVRFATEKGIPSNARGSACGALVSYVLGLSHVCPLEYDLLFERFLDPNRSEAPDIDIDFCQQRREEVIAYVRALYGEASVAQIATFGTMAAKAAIKDVGRVHDIPLDKVNLLTSWVPPKVDSLAAAIEQSPDLRKSMDSEPEIRRVMEIALRLEGTNRNTGTHAAGVVISNGPLTDHVPLQRSVRKNDDSTKKEDGPAVTTQWVMGDLEKIGLLKMDFLGLRTLTMLEHALELIRANHGITINLRTLPIDDPKVYRLLQRGDARGVFQLESPGIRELLKRLKPDNIRDIIALMALYRPGPLEGGMVDSYVNRKHGTEKATYAHPVMKEVLEETYGVMVYQEQIMRILNRLGGIELSSAYACIKAISKKKQDTIDQRREEFIRGAVERGLAREVAEEIFQLIVVFGGYGFNKSHSAAYAMIGYHTAYLKTHYLAEFMAALLTSEIDDANKRDILVEHIGDARRLGVEVLSPDVNLSEGRFHVMNGKIVFGMTAIKGVGAGASEAIMAARANGGPFKDIFEFCERVDPRLVPKTAIEKLIKAGAMDTFCSNRARMMAGLNGAVQGAVHRQSDLKRGQGNLFDQDIGGDGAATQDSSPELPEVPAWPEAERLKYEKEVLDFYFSSHPLAVHEKELKRFITHQIGDLKGRQGEEDVILAGLVTALKSGNTKKARNGLSRFLRFKIQDLSDICDCVIWPDDLAKLGEDPVADEIYYVKGRLEIRGDQPSVVVSRILTLDQAKRELAKGLYLRLRLDTHQNNVVDQVSSIIRKGTGSVPVLVKIQDAMERSCTLKLGKDFDINPQKLALDELEQLLGAENVRLG